MRYLLILLACVCASCADWTVDDTPILLRHRGGDAVDAGVDAGAAGAPQAGGAGQSGVAGAQAGAGGLAGSLVAGSGGVAGEPQGGAPSGGAGSGGMPAGNGGTAPSAGMSGVSGSAGSAGLAGSPPDGGSGSQAGMDGSAGAQDYFQGCPGNGTPGAPLWLANGGAEPSADYLAAIPLYGQVQAPCGTLPPAPSAGWSANDICLWICRDPSSCGQVPPDGSHSQTIDNVNAWGTPYCDCYNPNGASCASAPR